MTKFILNSFLLLSLFGIVSSAQSDSEFTSIMGNNGFKPSTDLRGLYSQSDDPQEEGHRAEIYFKTTMPSLNPDQSGVSDIECNDGKITLSLKDENAIDQINNWPDKVILLISNRWNCFDKKETQFYTVEDRNVDNNKVTFTAEECDITEMSEEFSVDVSWQDGGKKKRDVTWHEKKRNSRRRLYKRQKPFTSSKKLDLNVLFDEKTGKSSKPNFPLIDLEQDNTGESLVCANCFMQGEATITMRIAGKFLPKFELNDASVSINGNVRLNLEISFDGKIKGDISPLDVQILNTPLAPLGVAGIFNIGPSIILAASSKLTADVTGKVLTGGEISLPDFNAKATFVEDPKFEQSGFEPQTKSFDSDVNIDASASISGTLKPQLAFNLDVLNGVFSVKTGFEVISTLGAKISIGDNSGCNKNTQPHLESTLTGNLGFFVQNNDFSILDFPTVTLLDECL